MENDTKLIFAELIMSNRKINENDKMLLENMIFKYEWFTISKVLLMKYYEESPDQYEIIKDDISLNLLTCSYYDLQNGTVKQKQLENVAPPAMEKAMPEPENIPMPPVTPQKEQEPEKEQKVVLKQQKIVLDEQKEMLEEQKVVLEEQKNVLEEQTSVQEEEEEVKVMPEIKNGMSVIDDFLSKNITKIEISEEDDQYTDIADVENDEVLEEMADFLAKQKENKQAIEIYTKLSLKFPEKSVYFASVIEKLQEKDIALPS